MNEAEIRMQAKMLAIQAQIDAIKTEVLRMELENRDAHTQDQTGPWPGRLFSQAGKEIAALASRLETEI